MFDQYLIPTDMDGIAVDFLRDIDGDRMFYQYLIPTGYGWYRSRFSTGYRWYDRMFDQYLIPTGI
jgi:hypothetical protein